MAKKDIVERLNAQSREIREMGLHYSADVMRDAADEIGWLRADIELLRGGAISIDGTPES